MCACGTYQLLLAPLWLQFISLRTTADIPVIPVRTADSRSEEPTRSLPSPRPVAAWRGPAASHRHMSVSAATDFIADGLIACKCYSQGALFWLGHGVATCHCYRQQNDVSVNDGPNIRRWSNDIMLYIILC